MLSAILTALSLTALSSSPTASLKCGAIKGVDPFLTPGASVLLGEVHGTVEVPRFLADLSCLALKRGLRVKVMLEASIQENESFARFLASAGGPGDRARLQAGEHWQSEFPDGRSSKAMIDLLEEFRRQRAAGGDLVVLGLMGSDGAASGDAFMAQEFLRARKADPMGLAIVLAGGNHVRVRPGDDHSNVKWMGQHVVDAGVQNVVSLRMISGPGHYYNGQSQPRASWPGRTDYGKERFIRLGKWLPGHDGVFHVVTLTPSFPVSRRQAWGKK